jgi:hypothetical protein
VSQSSEKRKAQKKVYAKAYHVAHRGEKAAYDKGYRAAHRKKRAAYNKAYNADHKEENRARRLRRQYGISQTAFDALLNSQGGVCAACGKPDWNGKGPHVDHDHATGKVRGILCSNCNTILGHAKDNIAILELAIEYLREAERETEKV